MKSAHLPLVVTTPFAAALREKTLSLAAAKAKLSASNGMDVEGSESKVTSSTNSAEADATPMWILQRQTRAALVRQHLTGSFNSSNSATLQQQLNAANIHPPIALGPTNYVSELMAYRSFYRNRKQSRRDVKAWEKEDRRRRLELEDKRKKRAIEYHKALLAHREDFFRFHKGRKFGE